MRRLQFAVLSMSLLAIGAHAQTPEYSIEAIRYAVSPGVPVAELVVNGPKDQKVDIAMVVWLIRGGGHTILFDSGFHRDTFVKEFPMKNYLRPDEAVKTAGVNPNEVTDIVISHAHWDHMGGIDLFPKATVWIQREEYRYYTSDAWQKDGNHGGIDPEDVQALVKLNTEHRVRFVDGDKVEIFRVFARTQDRAIPTPRNICACRAPRHMFWLQTTHTSISIFLRIWRAQLSATRTTRRTLRSRNG
jgi:hypothetical protein